MELSSIGLGTYLGDPGPAIDGGYRESARAFAAAGGTVFDTAANYRMGRSERALGQVLGDLDRDSFFVSTKAGYLPMADGVTQESPKAWFQRVLAGPGVLSADEVVLKVGRHLFPLPGGHSAEHPLLLLQCLFVAFPTVPVFFPDKGDVRVDAHPIEQVVEVDVVPTRLVLSAARLEETPVKRAVPDDGRDVDGSSRRAGQLANEGLRIVADERPGGDRHVVHA